MLWVFNCLYRIDVCRKKIVCFPVFPRPNRRHLGDLWRLFSVSRVVYKHIWSYQFRHQVDRDVLIQIDRVLAEVAYCVTVIKFQFDYEHDEHYQFHIISF